MLQLKHQTVFLDISSLHGKTVLTFAAVPDAKEPFLEVKNDEFSFCCNGKDSVIRLNAKLKRILAVRIIYNGKSDDLPFEYSLVDESAADSVLNAKLACLSAIHKYELSFKIPSDFEPLHSFDIEVEYFAYHEAVFSRNGNELKFICNSWSQNRCWVPCIETSLASLCTWDLYFTCEVKPDLLFEATNSISHSVIASGNLEGQYLDDAALKKVYHYSIKVATHASSLLWACGYFEVMALPPIPNGFAFCSPGLLSSMKFTLDFLPKIYDYFTKTVLESPMPYDSLKIIFVESPPKKRIIGASLILLCDSFLYPESIIDQTFETRRIICESLAEQIFGVFYHPESWSDLWLCLGLQRFQAALGIRKIFGNNEFRFQLKEDAENVILRDKSYPPLYQRQYLSLDDLCSPFVSLKGYIVVYMMNRRLGYGRFFFSKLFAWLRRVQASKQTISTQLLKRFCEDGTGKDFGRFFDQWIYGVGCPKFEFSYSINRRRNIIEMSFSQKNSNDRGQNFHGPLTIRVHESDGTFDHVVHIDPNVSKFELPYHTKYKKIKRRKYAPDIAMDDDDDDQDDDGKDKKDKDNDSANSLIAWVRIDPELDWLADIELSQRDFVWADQLQRDKDVISQCEAIKALEKYPSQRCSGIVLQRAIMEAKNYYRVRMRAAMALSSCAIASLEWYGLIQLIRYFSVYYCYSEHANYLIARPNDFSHISNYFLQKSIVMAFRNIRYEDGRVPHSVIQFLLNILVFNDNSCNAFSDDYYIGTVILCLANLLTPSKDSLRTECAFTKHQFLDDCISEIERYRLKDILFPSYHGIITRCCLEFTKRLQVAGMIECESLDSYISYGKFGNFTEVRKVALQALVIFGSCSFSAMNFLVKIIESDPEHEIRVFLLREMSKMAKEKEAQFVENFKQHNLIPHLVNLQRNRVFLLYHSLRVELFELLELLDPEPFKQHFDSLKSIEFVRAHRADLPSYLNIHDLDLEEEKEVEELDLELEPLVSPMILDVPAIEDQVFEDNEVNVSEESNSVMEVDVEEKGLPLKLRQKCERFLNKIASLNEAIPFLYPVSTAVPFYYEIIENPMDLSVIRDNLIKGRYEKVEEFGLDLSQILENCLVFNEPETHFHNEGLKLGKFIAREWKKVSPEPAATFPSVISDAFDPSPYQDFWVSLCQKLDITGIVQDYINYDTFLESLKRFRLGSGVRKYLFQLYLTIRHEHPERNDIPDAYFMFDELRKFFHIPKSKEMLEAEQSRQEAMEQVQVEEFPITDEIQSAFDPSSVILGQDTLPRVITSLVWRFKMLPESQEFLFPVGKRVLNYYKVIKKPMDFQTMLIKSFTGQYSKFSEFHDDLQSIIKNCQKFNLPGSYFYIQSESLSAFYDANIYSFLNEELDREEMIHPLNVIKVECILQGLKNHYLELTGRKLEDASEAFKLLLQGDNADSQEVSLFVTDMLNVFEDERLTYRFVLFQFFVELLKKLFPDLELDDLTSNSHVLSEDQRKWLEFLEKILGNSLSGEFSYPIDPVAHNVPNYLEIVKRPIDFNVVKDNLLSGKYYRTLEEMVSDCKQVFENCYLFHSPESVIYRQCKSLESWFDKELLRMQGIDPSKKTLLPKKSGSFSGPLKRGSFTLIPVDLKRFRVCMDRSWGLEVLDAVCQHSCAESFQEPVDPVKLNLSDYHKIIKRPMDLGTIRTKILSPDATYTYKFELLQDIELVLTNCMIYNSIDSWIYSQAKGLFEHYEQLMSEKGEEAGQLATELKIKLPENILMSSEGRRKACRATLEKVKKQAFSSAFLAPVDPVALGIPKYYDVIRRPMDLGTVGRKIDRSYGSQTCLEDFDYDIRQIVINCKLFNAPTAPVSIAADKLEAFYAKEFEKVLLYGEFDERNIVMEEILKTLRNEKSSLYFRVPVDAKKLNVPTYYVIVKKPMDLATMAKKIRFQEYSSLDDFESDFDLIVSNCILFNGEVSVITNQVKEMESIFRKLIEEARHRISSINERLDQNNSK